MRFKLDENLPGALAKIFVEAGHDASTVVDQGIGGAADPDIASVCQSEGRAIVTMDMDFADIRLYPPQHYASNRHRAFQPHGAHKGSPYKPFDARKTVY